MTDDFLAVQAASAAAGLAAGVVYFPRGDYLLNTQVLVDAPQRWVGEGADIVLGASGYAINATLPLGGFNYALGYVGFRGLTFRRATYGLNTSGGIFLKGWSGATVEDCVFYGVGAPGVAAHHNVNLFLYNCRFPECFDTALVSLETASSGDYVGEPVYLATLEHCFFQYAEGHRNAYPTIVGAAHHLRVAHCNFGWGGWGLHLDRATTYGLDFSDNFVELCSVGVEMGKDVGGGVFSAVYGASIQRNHFTTTGASHAAAVGVKLTGHVSGVDISLNIYEVGTGVAFNAASQAGVTYDGNHLLDVDNETTGAAPLGVALRGRSLLHCRLAGAGALPAASATYRGMLWFEEGAAGVGDGLFICVKTAADTYIWFAL